MSININGQGTEPSGVQGNGTTTFSGISNSSVDHLINGAFDSGNSKVQSYINSMKAYQNKINQCGTMSASATDFAALASFLKTEASSQASGANMQMPTVTTAQVKSALAYWQKMVGKNGASFTFNGQSVNILKNIETYLSKLSSGTPPNARQQASMAALVYYTNDMKAGGWNGKMTNAAFNSDITACADASLCCVDTMARLEAKISTTGVFPLPDVHVTKGGGISSQDQSLDTDLYNTVPDTMQKTISEYGIKTPPGYPNHMTSTDWSELSTYMGNYASQCTGQAQMAQTEASGAIQSLNQISLAVSQIISDLQEMKQSEGRNVAV